MINILGLAGSGKSTQGQLLAKRIEAPWISIGQLLRDKADPKTKADMLKGKIVNDDVTLSLLDADLKAKQADQKECVVDGCPRTLNQAEWFVDKVKRGEIMMTGVIHLKAHQEVAKERLMHRARIDDTEEAIVQRFNDYKKTIHPILEYIESQGIPILEVDADGPIEEVEARIDKILGL